MKNKSTVHFDGICIYLNSEIRVALIGKVILIVFNLIAWAGFMALALSVPGEEVKSFLIAFFIIPAFLIFIVGRYTAWNLWGKEFIIVNTKAITYSRSYGIIQTNDTIIKIEKSLAFSYNRVRIDGEKEFGELHFFDYDENNNPRNIFETTILMTKEIAEEVIANIEDLYSREYIEKETCAPYSLN
jgi:hypothetical protein